MYTFGVSADRRYQLQSDEANRRVDALLEQLRVPASTWRLYAEMLTAVLKMLEDGAGVADLKIACAALKEMRYGFKVFAPYRQVRKVTVFGSARTSADHAVSRAGVRVRQAHDRRRVHGDDGGGERRHGLGPARGRSRALVRAQHPAALRAGSQSVDRQRSQARSASSTSSRASSSWCARRTPWPSSREASAPATRRSRR